MSFSSNESETVESGAISIFPSLPKLTIAPALSGVVTVLEEKIERPLCAASPLTKTPFPATVSSPATFAELAKATAEQVASNDILRHALSAFRIQSLLFIVLLSYRLTSIISKKSNLSMFYTNQKTLSIKTSWFVRKLETALFEADKASKVKFGKYLYHSSKP